MAAETPLPVAIVWGSVYRLVGTTERRCPMTSVPFSQLHASNRFRAALVLAGALVLASARTHPVVLAWAIVIVATCILTRQIELGNVSLVAHRRRNTRWSAATRGLVEADDLRARLDRALDGLSARVSAVSANEAAVPRVRSHLVSARVSYERGVRARTTCTPVVRISSGTSAAARPGRSRGLEPVCTTLHD